MPQYSTNVPITFTAIPLASLGNAVRTVSDPINNTATLYDEVDAEIQLKMGASGVLSTGSLVIGWFGSTDGVTYDNQLQGANVLENIGHLSNAKIIILRVRLTNVPAYWKLVIQNNSGAAFDSNPSNFSSVYAGIINSQQAPLTTNQINVTTSATALATASLNRQNLIVANHGSDTVFLGHSGVTISTGFALASGGTIQLPLFSGNSLYGIVPSVTSLVDVMLY